MPQNSAVLLVWIKYICGKCEPSSYLFFLLRVKYFSPFIFGLPLHLSINSHNFLDKRLTMVALFFALIFLYLLCATLIKITHYMRPLCIYCLFWFITKIALHFQFSALRCKVLTSHHSQTHKKWRETNWKWMLPQSIRHSEATRQTGERGKGRESELTDDSKSPRSQEMGRTLE